MLKKLFTALTVLCLMTVILSVTVWNVCANEADFRYDFLSSNEVLIIDYTGSDRTLTLPETLGGYTVAAIGEQGITGNDTLKSLTVPGTVHYLFDNALADCWSLEFVLFQDGLKKIGDGAFAFDYSLKRVVIPATVEAIGAGAFAQCGELTDVFYGGTQEQWNAVEKGDNNAELAAATIHFVTPTETATESESEPTVTETEITPTATEADPSTDDPTREKDPEKTASDIRIWGDANGDGFMNMKDVLAVRKFLAGLDSALTNDADVNGDGAVNMKDVLAMRRFLAGLDVAG